MIQVIPLLHTSSDEKSNIRSHILHPRPSTTIIVSIEWEKEHITSILEDHILETISATEWASNTSDQDFTFLTEHYNRFIKNIEKSDLDGISVLLGLLKGDHLIVSTIGNACAILVEWDSVTTVTSTESHRHDFHTMTDGDITRGTSIFLATTDVVNFLGEEILCEFALLSGNEFESAASSIIARELHEPLYLVRIASKYAPTPAADEWRRTKQSDIPRKIANISTYVANHQIIKNLRSRMRNVSIKENQTVRYAFLGLGAVLMIMLLVMFFRGISNGITTVSDEAKEKILQVQTLIEESQKLVNNPGEFESKIKTAEETLLSLRNEQKYLTDVQELTNRIEALKKEVYDIQPVDLTKYTPIIAGEAINLAPVNTILFNNKYTVAGKTGILPGYVADTEVGGLSSYPNGDTAVSMAVSDKGAPYVLSNNGRVYTLNNQNVAIPLITGGKETWDAGLSLRVYNSHIYILSEGQDQIHKYKPSGNGFTSKTNVFGETPANKILDFSIDGGYYLLLDDGNHGRVWRYLSTKNVGISGLDLNGIPGQWHINTSETSQIIGTNTLSYVYIRNGRRVWIFQPNSRQYQDITALTYVAQLELQSPDTIEHISIPRDGTIIVSTHNNVYSVSFEIVNDKIVIH